MAARDGRPLCTARGAAGDPGRQHAAPLPPPGAHDRAGAGGLSGAPAHRSAAAVAGQRPRPRPDRRVPGRAARRRRAPRAPGHGGGERQCPGLLRPAGLHRDPGAGCYRRHLPRPRHGRVGGTIRCDRGAAGPSPVPRPGWPRRRRRNAAP